MARIFTYEYLENERTMTVIKPDSDETTVIPEKGEILVQNGKIWRVVSIKFAGHDPERESQVPMSVFVTLKSMRSLREEIQS